MVRGQMSGYRFFLSRLVAKQILLGVHPHIDGHDLEQRADFSQQPCKVGNPTF